MREFKSLKFTYSVDFDENTLLLWGLLYNIKTSNQQTLFFNLNVALSIFSTIPESVLTGIECVFLALIRGKDVYVRPHVSLYQNRLLSLGVLTVDTDLAKNINLDDVIIVCFEKTIINTIAKDVLSYINCKNC